MLTKALNKVDSDDDDWASLGSLGNHLNRTDPSFDARSYGFAKLGDLVKGQPFLETKTVTGASGRGQLWVRLKRRRAPPRVPAKNAPRRRPPRRPPRSPRPVRTPRRRGRVVRVGHGGVVAARRRAGLGHRRPVLQLRHHQRVLVDADHEQVAAVGAAHRVVHGLDLVEDHLELLAADALVHGAAYALGDQRRGLAALRGGAG